MDLLLKQLIPVKETAFPVLPLLISDTDHLQAKGRLMSHLRADSSPSRVCTAVCKLDQIQILLYIFVDLGGIQVYFLVRLELARQSHAENRERFCTQILAQQEILVETDPIGLSIVRIDAVESVLLAVFMRRPAVPVVSPILPAPQRVLEPIPVCQRRALHDTAARKTQESRVQVLQAFCQIPAKNAAHRIRRHHGKVIELHSPRALQQDDKVRIPDFTLRAQIQLIPNPMIPPKGICRFGLNTFFADSIFVLYNGDRQTPLIIHTSRIEGNRVFHARAHVDAVVRLVRKTTLFLCRLHPEIMRIVHGYRTALYHRKLYLHIRRIVSPRIQTVMLYTVVFFALAPESFQALKIPVLQQFGMQTTVHGIIDVLDKKPHKLLGDIRTFILFDRQRPV